MTDIPRSGEGRGGCSTHQIRSIDDTSIFFDLYAGTVPRLVIVVPGFWRTRRHPSILHLVATLLQDEYHVAVMDIRGHGESGGRFGFNRNEHFDVDAVRDAAVEKSGCRAVSLVGLSAGGAICATTAARHPFDYASLLLISPVADFRRVLPRLNPLHFRRHLDLSQISVRPRFGLPLGSRSLIRADEEIRTVRAPLCVIHATRDWLVHHRHGQRLYDAAPGPKELHLLDLPDGYHADRIFSAAPGVAEAIIRRFLAETLGSDPRPEP